MIEKVLDAVNRFSLISSGDTVTVALSGGADSVALLHALWSLKDKLSITVRAAHLNHGIRGGEADRDEAFAKWLCLKLDIPIVTETVDIPALAKERGQSVELCAREVRYDFLRRNSEGLVATAHTASDNIETVLLNLTRGSGIKGLCGIPPKRDNFIRPLIFCSRYDIEKYCIDNSLSYVTDSTNLTDDYTRNKIRHKVVTALKEINPSLEDALVRATDILREDNEALEILAQETLFKCESENGLVADVLKTVPVAIAKRTIIKYVNSLYEELSLDSFHINALYDVALNGGKTSLPNNLFGICENGILTVVGDETAETVQFTVTLTKKPNVNNLFSNDTLDCDKIVGSPVVRTRREGDKIRLKNRGCTKLLNKIFCEEKIPQNLRDNLPVIADDKGVIWVYGIGLAQRVAPTVSSENLLLVEVLK